jgi:hypothetical protein
MRHLTRGGEGERERDLEVEVGWSEHRCGGVAVRVGGHAATGDGGHGPGERGKWGPRQDLSAE